MQRESIALSTEPTLISASRIRIAVGLLGLAALLLTSCARTETEPSALPTPTPDPGRWVTVASTASVVVMPGDRIDPKALRAVAPFPGIIRLAMDELIAIRAVAFDGRGLPMTDVEYRWILVDELAGFLIEDAGGSASPVQLRAADRPGFYPDALRVTAVEMTPDGAREVSATLDVTIMPPPPLIRLAAVEALIGLVQASQGQIVRLRAIAYDQLGRILPDTRFEWNLDDPSVGTLSSLGYLTINADPGDYPEALILRGAYGDLQVETRVPIRVLKRADSTAREITTRILPGAARLTTGSRFRFHAVTIDGRGQLIQTRDASWTVLNPEAGMIDEEGVFHVGDTTGTFLDAIEYRATGSTKSEDGTMVARATITVRPRPTPPRLESVAVRPVSGIIAHGETILFRVAARDAAGRRIVGADVEWQLLKAEAGVIDELGRFTATGEPGRYEAAVRVVVRQEIDGKLTVRFADADILVAGEMVKVSITPRRAVVTEGEPLFFRAKALDGNGFEVPGVLFEWTVAEPEAGVIGAIGVFVAGSQPGVHEDVIQVTARQRLER